MISSDWKILLDIIEMAYAIEDREEMFLALCLELEGMIGIESAVLVDTNVLPESAPVRNTVLFNFDPDHYSLFLDYYIFTHPLLNDMPDLEKAGRSFFRTVSLNDVISDTRLAETEYHRDFQTLLPAFYEVGGMLGLEGNPPGMVGFHRPRRRRRFDRRERRIIEFLLPHLARSMRFRNLLAQSASQDWGVLYLDKKGRMAGMNNAAARLLRQRRPEDHTSNENPGDTRRSGKNQHPFHVHALPAAMTGQKQTLLLVPRAESDRIKGRLAAFGLTRRQTEVALLVIKGFSNREISERLFIEVQTVKDHLKSVFEKTGVKKRTALSAKILGIRI